MDEVLLWSNWLSHRNGIIPDKRDHQSPACKEKVWKVTSQREEAISLRQGKLKCQMTQLLGGSDVITSINQQDSIILDYMEIPYLSFYSVPLNSQVSY